MNPKVVALIGERDLGKRAHAGIEASVALFQRQAGASVSFRWVATASIAPGAAQDVVGDAAGIWCAPGSPYERTEGALEAIRYARVNGKPFLGTCGGFQHALMEYCAAVLGRAADHQELVTEAKDYLIDRDDAAILPGCQFCHLGQDGAVPAWLRLSNTYETDFPPGHLGGSFCVCGLPSCQGGGGRKRFLHQPRHTDWNVRHDGQFQQQRDGRDG